MKSLRHAGIVVGDMDRSLGFYRDLLGLKVKSQKSESSQYIDAICGTKGAELTTVKLAAQDGSLIELLCFGSRKDRKVSAGKLDDIGLTHISFTVDDAENEYRRLAASGIEFNSKPQVSPDGYAKVVFCKDPDGVFVELVEVLKK